MNENLKVAIVDDILTINSKVENEYPEFAKDVKECRDRIKEIGEELGIETSIVTSYNYPGNGFKDVLKEEQDFYIVDGNFPVYLNKDTAHLIKNLRRLLEDFQRSRRIEDMIAERLSYETMGDWEIQLYETLRSKQELSYDEIDRIKDWLARKRPEVFDGIDFGAYMHIKEAADSYSNYMKVFEDPEPDLSKRILDGLKSTDEEERILSRRIIRHLAQAGVISEEDYENFEKLEEELKKVDEVYRGGGYKIHLENIDHFAGLLAMNELNSMGKRYLLYTLDTSHGRFSLYPGLAHNLIDFDNFLHNSHALIKYHRNQTMLMSEQEIKERGVFFSREYKLSLYPLLLRRIVEAMA